MTRRLHSKSGGVAHHLPHRTRLRLPMEHRTPGNMEKVSQALRKTPGVHKVEVNHHTGSIVVHHEEDTGILGAFEKSIGEVSTDVLEALVTGGSPELLGLSLVGHFVANLFSSADDKVSGATKNLVDLKMAAPLALLGLGFMRLARSRGEDILMGISPLVLFYWAFDVYYKFHSDAPEPAEASVSLETARISSHMKKNTG